MSGDSLSLDDSVVVDEHVVFRELDGETVILNLGTGNYFGLDDVGTRMWTLMREHQVLRTVLGVLLTEYDVSSETLQTDLLQLTEQLQVNGLAHLKRAG